MPTTRAVIEIETIGPYAAKRLLRLVQYGVRKANRAVTSRDTAVREAHRAGASLRDIAEVAGVSHMTIKRIVERQPAE